MNVERKRKRERERERDCVFVCGLKRLLVDTRD